MQIQTDALGELRLTVSVHEQSVRATVLADYDRAREALLAHQPLLEGALQRHHLRLDGFEVNVGTGGGSGETRGWGQAHEELPRNSALAAGAAAPEVVAGAERKPPASPAEGRRVSVRA